MRRSWWLPFLTLAIVARTARAGDSESREQDRRTFSLRFAASAGLIEGSRLVGHGSRERFAQASIGMIDMRIMRTFSSSRFGVDLAMILMVPTDHDTQLAYGLLELGGTVVLGDGHWGSVIAGAGGGGDFGRYWWDGRGYPFLFVHGRTWLSEKVRLEMEARTIPVAANAKLLPMFEQRFELAMGIGLFAFGMRFNWTALVGGRPERAYQQHEIGAFVGIGL